MTPARRSSIRYLVLIFLVGAVFGRLLVPLSVRLEGSAPLVGRSASVFLLFCALVVGALAWQTWQQLHRKKLRMNADRAIMLLATAKASIMVGGIFCGGYTGFALAFVGDDSPLAHERLLNALLAAGAAALLLGAALFLEWACTLPEDDNEEKETGTSPA